ncbi:Annexin-B12 [Arthrobotrys entomopaga]|nr:Annexin-B12 [Arthrobotrys entomopaga]
MTDQHYPPPSGDPNQQQWGQQPPQQQWGQPQQQWGQPQQQWGQPQQQWGPPQGQYQQQYPPQGPPQGPPQDAHQQGAPQGDQSRGYPPPPQQQQQWGQQQPQQQQWGPPQQQWGAPQGPPQNQSYPQQQWGQPQGYPPPQQQQGQWGAPQGYQQPPPQGYPPPQQPYGGAPPTHPPQPGYTAAAPGGPHGQQPLAGPSGPAARPSLGFVPNQTDPSYNATHDVEVIRKACKGFNTDERALITTFVKLNPLQIESVNQKYMADTKKPLESLIKDKTRGSFEDTLLAIVRGPLQQNVFLVMRATEGLGTKEHFLDMALLGRSNADMNAIKKAFQARYGKSMESVVRPDLSGDEQRMFDMVMSATRTEDSAGVNPAQVTADVRALHGATEAMMGTNETEVSRIFIKNNDATIAAIAREYEKTYNISVESLIKKEFSGHQEDALLYILKGVLNKADRDAEYIELTMKGIGTKDEELAYRLVAAHWVPGYMAAVKTAYRRMYGKELVAVVRSETRGDFEDVLVALLQ